MALIPAGLGLLLLIWVAWTAGIWKALSAAIGASLLGAGLLATLGATLTDVIGSVTHVVNQLAASL